MDLGRPAQGCRGHARRSTTSGSATTRNGWAGSRAGSWRRATSRPRNWRPRPRNSWPTGDGQARRRRRQDRRRRSATICATGNSPKQRPADRAGASRSATPWWSRTCRPASTPACPAICAASRVWSRPSMTAPTPISARPARTGWACRCHPTACASTRPISGTSSASPATARSMPTCSKSISKPA